MNQNSYSNNNNNNKIVILRNLIYHKLLIK